MYACFVLLLITVEALHLRPAAGIQQHAAGTCIPHERDALLAFKRGITEDDAGRLTSWQEANQDCCQWRSVRCSNRSGHVVKLLLRYVHSHRLKVLRRLVGEISPSLLILNHLQHLDLSMNRLEGSTGRIPEFLGSLENLKYLNLSGINFVGTLPPQLGNLTKLQYLDFHQEIVGNGLNSADASWLAQLRFLQHLDLSGVNLSTVSDWPDVVNMIPSLKFLDLSFSDLASANQSLPHFNLTNLEWLDLFDNHFSHTVASCWFWNITNLMHLDLGSNHLYGQPPIAHMTSLQYIDFTFNKGLIMANMSKLCNLQVLALISCFSNIDTTNLFESLPDCFPNRLQELVLADNNISGVLPSGLGHLTSLTNLDLGYNNITGSIPPALGHLPALSTLGLYYNHFSGHVPDEIGMLSNLTELYLDNNDLNGVITEERFKNLKSLQYIDLSYNSLRINISSEWQPPFRVVVARFAACQMGPKFPSWLRWLVGAEEIDVSSAGINDQVPDWFSNVFSHVAIIDMSNNHLHGGLPENMEHMSLAELYLSSNWFSGIIPPLPPNLTVLEISMNSLSGPLPSNFGSPYMVTMSLFSNQITGQIPVSICKCEHLEELDLANNFLEGELPLCFRGMYLDTLDLSNNSFSGEFPTSVQNSEMLVILDLAWNNFSGTLPTWIGTLVRLHFLRLSHNMFSGKIPKNITNLRCLHYLDIADNDISGPLPKHLSNFAMMRMNYWAGRHAPADWHCTYYTPGRYHGASLSAVTKRQQLNYGTGYSFLDEDVTGINLSMNNLSGELTEDLGTLDALLILNLSWNQFSGNILRNIGAMQSLESLDLSRNKLSGEIPTSLSNWTFLGFLDLSYNNLTGRIPSGTQLDTLYASRPSMYDGNLGLCGSPLKNNCSGNNASEQCNSRIEEAPELETFLFGLGLGFTVGFWAVFFTMLCCKPWRFAYFGFFDRLEDKTHVLVIVTWARLTTKRTTAN